MENTSTTTGLNKTSLLFTDFPSKSEGMAWRIVYTLETLLIVLFVVNKNLRKKRFFLAVNMALVDLFYGAVKMSFSVYFIYIDKCEIWTENRSSTAFDYFYNFITFFLAQGSLLCAAIICGEMCYAVHWPLKHRTLSTSVYRIVKILTWTMAFLVSLTCTVLFHLTSRKLTVNIMMPFFWTLLSIVCGCNIGIWRTFRRKNIALQQRNHALQHQRLTKTMLLVSILALMSWVPVLIVTFLISCGFTISSRIYHMTIALNVSSSFVNPIIYALRIPDFRRSMGFCKK